MVDEPWRPSKFIYTIPSMVSTWIVLLVTSTAPVTFTCFPTNLYMLPYKPACLALIVKHVSRFSG